MRDKVTLIKQDGQRFEGLKASVQTDMIFTGDPKVPIEEGDVFERTLPSGVTERYTILDAGFNAGLGGIKPHYQSKVQKETKIQPAQPPTHVFYNLLGPNSRVNIQSVDASTNVVDVGSEELFEKLKADVRESIFDRAVVDQLCQKVDELKEAKGTPGFTSKYQEFIAIAADHITLLAPFIPALTQMLG